MIIRTREDLDRAIKAHRDLWDWLSKNPEKGKEYWEGWNKYREYISNNCFCCEIMHRSAYNPFYTGCNGCILDWGVLKETYACESYESPYFKWRNSFDMEERKFLAEKIRDLPINDEVYSKYFKNDNKDYIVINKSDIQRYLPSEIQEKFKEICDEIVRGRNIENKKINKYLVVNIDEHYAGKVADLIEMGEREKKSWEYGNQNLRNIMGIMGEIK